MSGSRPGASAVSRGEARRLRGGFTLLEILLALGLCTLLLLAVSSAISLHLRAFDTGRTDVEQAQLARALLRRLGDDLRSTVAPPAPVTAPPDGRAPPPAGDLAMPATAAGSRPWLEGEARRLRLVVRRPKLPRPAGHEATDGDVSIEHWAGLVQVAVELVGTSADGAISDAEAPPDSGLVREARVWLPGEEGLSPSGPPNHLVSGSDGTSDRWTGPESLPATSQSINAAETEEDLANQPPDLVSITVPEVVDLAFRYFDGQSWHNQWTADPQRGLPRAVEIRLALAGPHQAAELRRQGPHLLEPEPGQTELPAESTAAGRDLAPPRGAGPPQRSTLEVYRDVIWLPAGQDRSPGQEFEEDDASLPPSSFPAPAGGPPAASGRGSSS